MNKIILGTANFADNYGIKKQRIRDHKGLKDCIVQLKIDRIDAAVGYNANKFISDYYSTLKVDTKIYSNNCNSYQDLKKYINILMGECNLTKIETLYLHDPWSVSFKDLERIFKYFDKLKEEKFISKSGISIYWDRWGDCLKLNPDVIQLPFSICHGRALDYLSKIKAKNDIEIIARNIFLQGLILADAQTLDNLKTAPKFLIDFIKKNYSNISVENRIANALKIVNNELIDRVIVGVDSVFQLRGLIRNYPSSGSMPDIKEIDLNLLDARKW